MPSLRSLINENDRELLTKAGYWPKDCECFDFGPWLNLPEPSQKVWDFLNKQSYVMTTDSLGLKLRPESPQKRPRSKSRWSSLAGEKCGFAHQSSNKRDSCVQHGFKQFGCQIRFLIKLFSAMAFNTLLFYSLAVPQIYCGSGGIAVSHLSHFPECNTHTHTHIWFQSRRGRECLLAGTGIGALWAVVLRLPWSFLVVFKLYTSSHSAPSPRPHFLISIGGKQEWTGMEDLGFFWQCWR